jgi:hypothetical protein
LNTQYVTHANRISRAEKLSQLVGQEASDEEAEKKAAASNKIQNLSTIGSSTAKRRNMDPSLRSFLVTRNAEIEKGIGLDVSAMRKQLKMTEQQEVEEEDEGKLDFFISEMSLSKFYWDVGIIVLAIFNTITIPVAVAFEPEWASSDVYMGFDLLFNFIYMLDIVVNFRTTFYVDGIEQRDCGSIASRYVAGNFAIDLLSSIPYGQLTAGNDSAQFLKLIAILKAVRVSRIRTLVNKMSIDEESKASLKIIYLIFQIFLAMHIVGSMWYYLVSIDMIWIPPLDFIYAGSETVYAFWDFD